MLQFFIYRTRAGFALAAQDEVLAIHADEGSAIDGACRVAQAFGKLYTINYWRP